MNKQTKIILFVIDIIVMAITIIWYYKSRDYEPLIGIFTCIAGFITLFFLKEKEDTPKPTISQSQSSGNNSTNYQAGRDLNIGK